MQFFNTICEIHRGKFLFEKSMKKNMKKVHDITLSHTELICLQYLIHNPETSLYDLSKLSGLDVPQLSQVIKKMEKKKLIEKTTVSEVPLKLSLSLTSFAMETLELYRVHMARDIYDSFDDKREFDVINKAITDYHSIIEKLAGRLL